MAENGDDRCVPEGITRLRNQVAGHSANREQSDTIAFYECQDGTILKKVQLPPKGPREVEFYKELFSPAQSDPHLLQLQKLVPKFFGMRERRKTEEDFIQLEDLTRNFKMPNILDLKMGAITYDPLASPEKIACEKSKYPPQATVGFQVTGMRRYCEKETRFVMSMKEELRSWNKEEVYTQGFCRFFPVAHRRCILSGLLSQLQLVKVWFESQRCYCFYASSILIVCEATMDSDDMCNGACVTAKMIDFTHAFKTDKRDDNYMYGLNSLISYINRLQACTANNVT